MKNIGGPVVIGGDNLPSLVRIGLSDLQNIGGASGPPGPPVPAPLICINKERSCERVDYDQFLPRNGLFGSLQRFLNH